MTKKRAGTVSLTLVLGMLLVTAASASPGFRSANNCLPSTEGTTGIGRGATTGSIFSADTLSAKSLICPVSIDSTTINPTGARVDFYDTSSVDDVSCTPYFDDDTAVVSLGTRYSCATAGGCTSESLSWSGGSGSLTWGDTIASVSGELSATFGCSLGVVDSAEIMQIFRYKLAY